MKRSLECQHLHNMNKSTRQPLSQSQIKFRINEFRRIEPDTYRYLHRFIHEMHSTGYVFRWDPLDCDIDIFFNPNI